MDMWKVAAVGFGIATILLWRKLHRGPVGVGIPRGSNVIPIGPAIRDRRGNDDLGIRQALLGAKKVAEGAKVAQLGPEKAEAREADQAQRKG